MTAAPLSPQWRALADRVVAEYRAAIGDDLVAIALFGSVARGQARPDSDLDLYVVDAPADPRGFPSARDVGPHRREP